MTAAQTTHEIVQKLPALEPSGWPEWFRPPAHWPAQGDLLQWCQHMNPGMAALLILLGVIYLLFGFKIFKPLVMLNAAAVGSVIGFLMAQRTDLCYPLMLLCGFLAAALTWPMMKWAVAVMGGLFGALLGASVWQTCGLDPTFAWSGALTGLVLFFLIAFIIVRGSITMYMSLQGSTMLLFGMLGVVCKYDQLAPRIMRAMTMRPFILPMAVLIAATLGLLFQHSAATNAPAKKPAH